MLWPLPPTHAFFCFPLHAFESLHFELDFSFFPLFSLTLRAWPTSTIHIIHRLCWLLFRVSRLWKAIKRSIKFNYIIFAFSLLNGVFAVLAVLVVFHLMIIKTFKQIMRLKYLLRAPPLSNNPSTRIHPTKSFHLIMIMHFSMLWRIVK